MNFKIVKSAFVGLFLSLFLINAQAQNKTVTGKVTDSKDGSAIVAASVVGQGTTIGVRHLRQHRNQQDDQQRNVRLIAIQGVNP